MMTGHCPHGLFMANDIFYCVLKMKQALEDIIFGPSL